MEFVKSDFLYADKNGIYKYDTTYTYQGKTADGQYIRMDFDKYGDETIYYVALAIGKKRKTVQSYFYDYRGNAPAVDLTQTGKGGIANLLFAKAIIQDFIDNVLEEEESISVTGADNRRYKVYKRGLESLGFKQYGKKNELLYHKGV